jgi:hypothetical protein
LQLGVMAQPLSEEMKHLEDQQTQIKEWLSEVEAKIMDLEAAYLDDSPHGNVVKGWEGFLDG